MSSPVPGPVLVATECRRIDGGLGIRFLIDDSVSRREDLETECNGSHLDLRLQVQGSWVQGNPTDIQRGRA